MRRALQTAPCGEFAQQRAEKRSEDQSGNAEKQSNKRTEERTGDRSGARANSFGAQGGRGQVQRQADGRDAADTDQPARSQVLIAIRRRCKPDAAKNQRYTGQHRHRCAPQTHQDQGRRKYIERDVDRSLLIAAAGNGAAWIQE
jgi:hypothetical protein